MAGVLLAGGGGRALILMEHWRYGRREGIPVCCRIHFLFDWVFCGAVSALRRGVIRYGRGVFVPCAGHLLLARRRGAWLSHVELEEEKGGVKANGYPGKRGF